MKGVVTNLLLPRNIPGVLGRIVGALSVTILIKHGFEFGVSRTFDLVFTYYDALLGLLFSWVEPYISVGLTWLGDLFSLNLNLHPHWKHIFVLIWIYFFRDAATDFQKGFFGSGVFLFVWGAIVALATSVASGVVAPVTGNWKAQFGIAFFPVLGAFFFTLPRRAWHVSFLRGRDGESKSPNDDPASHPNTIFVSDRRTQPTLKKTMRWDDFLGTLFRAIARTVIGGIIIILGLHTSPIREMKSPGIFLLGVLVFLLAIYWLCIGASRVGRNRKPGESWGQVFWNQSATQLGSSMIGVFFWSVIFIVSNAGLRVVGL